VVAKIVASSPEERRRIVTIGDQQDDTASVFAIL
jgi:hypothetical protein